MFSLMGLTGAEKIEKMNQILNMVSTSNTQDIRVQGVTVVYGNSIQARTGCDNKTYYGKIGAGPGIFDDPDTKLLPISTLIGLPLLYRKDSSNAATDWIINTDDQGFRGPKGTHQGEINEAFELLAVDVNPLSPTYGKPTDSARCDVQLVRADRKDLESEHVEALRMYVFQCRKFLFQQHLLSAEEAAANPFMISPKSFWECFKTIQHQQVKQNRNMAWAILFPGKVC